MNQGRSHENRRGDGIQKSVRTGHKVSNPLNLQSEEDGDKDNSSESLT